MGQIGTDGQRVQEFVRSIHPTQPILRNDFSNIGIPPQNDNWDNISITSVSAHAVPYTQVRIILYLLTGYEGNNKFIDPEISTIARGEAKGNSWYQGVNKLTIP